MRQKYIILIVLLVCLLTPLTVFAGNDGYAKDNPFGDCGADVSFGGDAKFYDFLIPYNITVGDIGGYASSCYYKENSNYYGWYEPSPMTKDNDTKSYGGYNLYLTGSRLDKKAGQSFNIEGNILKIFSSRSTVSEADKTWLGYPVATETETGLQYVSMGGCTFYMSALPKAVFNYSAASSEGFKGWGLAIDTGILFDMILKDGTVIHFAQADGVGVYHSNNDSSDKDSEMQDGIQFTFSSLKLQQYKNLFYATSPAHTFELMATDSNAISKFKNKYGISDSNPIVAIRMWNKTIKDGNLTVNSGFTGFGNRGTAIDTTITSVSSSQLASGHYSEMSLAQYQALTEPDLQEQYLDNANRENLGQSDLESLHDWERNQQMNQKEHGFISVLRWIVVLIGILMTIWALLVYLAFWADHLNSIVYVDFLQILTLGQLHICQPNEKPTFHLGRKVKTRTVDHWQILGICLTAMCFGALLISGIFYQLIAGLVRGIQLFIQGKLFR